MELLVRCITREADGIHSFELVDPDGAELVAFAAGSHVDVAVPGGALRQYSLCNDPRERHRYVIAVLREAGGRGGSVCMHDRVRVGDRLEVSAPRNNFKLEESAPRHLLIAGGIGVTPLLAMIHRLRALGRDWELHYCTRSPARTAFIDSLRESGPGGRVHFHHDGGDPARGLDVQPLLAAVHPGTHLYCCGPAGLMAAVKGASAHWPPAQVHFEYFAAPVAAPAAAGVASVAAESEFEVQIASTGQIFSIPRDRTILAVLSAGGVTVESSCEAGVCGTCRTRYLAGEPDHRDFVLMGDEPREFIMLCVSRSRGTRLVLDL